MDRIRETIIKHKKELVDTINSPYTSKSDIKEILIKMVSQILYQCKICPIPIDVLKSCKWFLDVVTICKMIANQSPDDEFSKSLDLWLKSDKYTPCSHYEDYIPTEKDYMKSLSRIFINKKKIEPIQLEKKEPKKERIKPSTKVMAITVPEKTPNTNDEVEGLKKQIEELKKRLERKESTLPLEYMPSIDRRYFTNDGIKKIFNDCIRAEYKDLRKDFITWYRQLKKRTPKHIRALKDILALVFLMNKGYGYDSLGCFYSYNRNLITNIEKYCSKPIKIEDVVYNKNFAIRLKFERPNELTDKEIDEILNDGNILD